MSTNKIIVTGGAGFLGRSVVAALRRRGVPDERLFVPRSAQHDLRDPRAAAAFMQSVVSAPLGAGWGSGEDGSVEGLAAPLIIHCAGRVGGIGLNRAHPAGMLHDNLTIALNTCEAAVKAGFADAGGKFVMVGSMTSYPADAELPYREESLFCGLPDPEIASYGLAKLAAIQMLRAYRLEHGLRGSCPILVNLYGPGDNIDDPLVAHAAGAMIKRFVEAADKNAPEVVCWGSPARGASASWGAGEEGTI